MREAAAVIGDGGKILYWHLPDDRSSVHLPDDVGNTHGQKLWDFIVSNLSSIEGIAHSHPGDGTPYPSYTDITTFIAVEKALGRIDWWIISSDSTTQVNWKGPKPEHYECKSLNTEPSWVTLLRQKSEYLSMKETEYGLNAT